MDKDEIPKSDESIKKRRGRIPGRSQTFPRDTLVKSLQLAESIEKNNAGKQFDITLLAQSLKNKPSSGSFRQLISSSSKYGLTKGGSQSKALSLTELGNSIVEPTNENEKTSGLIKALMNPPLFKTILEFYNAKQLPEESLFKNSLKRQFDVEAEYTEKVHAVLMNNIRYLKLIEKNDGNEYLNLYNSKLSSLNESDTVQIETTNLKNDDNKLDASPNKPIQPKPELIATVFLSHSKNMKILEQIESVLTFGNFKFEIAENEETTAIPIPKKIFGLMRKCNCAIINVSADEQEKREDGSYGINQNVLIEIGAAFLLYNKKVILLVDKRVKLPSNLQGLYQSQYEGDELNWNTGMKLQEALSKFRLNDENNLELGNPGGCLIE